MKGSVTVHFAAPAAQVWDLVSDITRIGEFSPGESIVNTWRYQLNPVAGGTDVTESFELPGRLPFRLYWALAGRGRMRTNLTGMRVTLEKMKAVAENEPAG